MPGNVVVDCQDQHLEIPPSGGATFVPHRFQSHPRAHAAFMTVQGGHPLTEGDEFKNEAAPDHQAAQTGGSFANSAPSQQGAFVDAGQSFVRISGRAWITTNGRMETCSDACPQRRVDAGVTPLKKALLSINSQSAITGW